MYFGEIFYKHRRSEPISVRVLRVLMMLAILVLLFGYTVILTIEIYHDKPVLRNSLLEADTIPIPDLIFYSLTPFKLSCTTIDNKNRHAIETACQPYLTQSVNTIQNITYYYGTFSMALLNFTRLWAGESSINSIGMFFNFSDGTVLREDLLHMEAFDSEFNPFKDTFFDNTQLQNQSVFVTSISSMNGYSLSPGQAHVFKFSRTIKESIVPSFTDHLGVPPQYNSQPFITSTLLTHTLENAVNGSLGYLEISPQSFITNVETEERSHTVINSLGLIGGAWAFSKGLYAILFGTDAVRPWGFLQTYCYGLSGNTKRKLRDSMPVLPLINRPHTQEGFKLKSADKRFLVIEEEMDAIKVLLRDYVVDVEYLERLRHEQEVANYALHSFGLLPNSKICCYDITK